MPNRYLSCLVDPRPLLGSTKTKIPASSQILFCIITSTIVYTLVDSLIFSKAKKFTVRSPLKIFFRKILHSKI
jgi:hypothetical protein